MRLLSLPLLLNLASTGCALSERLPIEDPDQVSTRDISITLAVTGSSAGTVVDVSLTGPTGGLWLSPTDEVRLGPLALAAVSKDGKRVYSASTPALEGMLSLVVTRRADEGIEVPIEVPPPPTMSAPIGAVVRSAPITLAWAPPPAIATHETQLHVRGSCIAPLDRTLGFDAGAYTIAAGDLLDGATKGASCPITISVERRVNVQRTRVYGLVSQSRSVVVESTP